jgi:hypothetical protein
VLAADERAHGILEVAVPYQGLTPHRWSVEASSAGVRVAGTKRYPATAGVGAGGYELFHLELGDNKDTVLTFKLQAPWDRNPARTRKLIVQRRG